jgi:hypothetical protein
VISVRQPCFVLRLGDTGGQRRAPACRPSAIHPQAPATTLPARHVHHPQAAAPRRWRRPHRR